VRVATAQSTGIVSRMRLRMKRIISKVFWIASAGCSGALPG
jgi:hypothetical protein